MLVWTSVLDRAVCSFVLLTVPGINITVYRRRPITRTMSKVLINLNHGRRWQIIVHLTRRPNVAAASFSGRIAAAERVCGVVRLAMQTKHLT